MMKMRISRQWETASVLIVRKLDTMLETVEPRAGTMGTIPTLAGGAAAKTLETSKQWAEITEIMFVTRVINAVISQRIVFKIEMVREAAVDVAVPAAAMAAVARPADVAAVVVVVQLEVEDVVASVKYRRKLMNQQKKLKSIKSRKILLF